MTVSRYKNEGDLITEIDLNGNKYLQLVKTDFQSGIEHSTVLLDFQSGIEHSNVSVLSQMRKQSRIGPQSSAKDPAKVL